MHVRIRHDNMAGLDNQSEDERILLLDGSHDLEVHDDEPTSSVRDSLEADKRTHKNSYEEAIAATGYGKFQYGLLLLCGWALSSDAVEVLSISFILPLATCDLNLSGADKGWINSAVFLGMLVGGYLWGTLADIKGRQSVLLWSLSVNALGGLGSSFAQSYWLFVLLRFISGMGVGGSLPVIFAYYTEFQPKDKRGAMISLLATFWMCGNIIAAGLAWIIIPRNFSVTSGYFHYNSWRLYLAICIVPCFTSALVFVLMPESPKFLIEKGQKDKALRVLERVYLTNRPKQQRNVPYKVTSLDVEQSKQVIQGISRGWLQDRCSSFFGNTADLFRAPMTSVTIVMITIMFTLSFGYYGLFMWFPELFQRIELYGGSACRPGNMSAHVNQSVDECVVSSRVYVEGFLTAISNLPGNIFTIFIIDRVGRKPLLAISMVISGLSVFFIWFLDTHLESLIMSCIFSGVSVIGFNVLDVLGTEVFPTKLRTTANGIMNGMGRIAAVLANQIFGLFIKTNCAIPMVLVASLLSFGGLASYKLPNTTKRDLL